MKLIPKPRVQKLPLTVEVEAGLLQLVKIEAKKEGLTLRQIVEYGLFHFLGERKKK